MASATDIANAALTRLGAARITDVADTAKEHARVMLAAIPIARDRLLAAYRWAFAMKRVSLPADADARWGFDYAYTLPADFLRIDQVGDQYVGADMSDYRNTDEADFSIESGKILTNLSAPLPSATSAACPTASDSYSPHFVAALALVLANTCACASRSRTPSSRPCSWEVKDIIARRSAWARCRSRRSRSPMTPGCWGASDAARGSHPEHLQRGRALAEPRRPHRLRQVQGGLLPRRELHPAGAGPGRVPPGPAFVAQTKTNDIGRSWLMPVPLQRDAELRDRAGRPVRPLLLQRGQLLYPGTTPYEITAPYAANDLINDDGTFKPTFAQSNDVIFWAHPDYYPRLLERHGHTDWSFRPFGLAAGGYTPSQLSFSRPVWVL
jgi:hypothetical protein